MTASKPSPLASLKTGKDEFLARMVPIPEEWKSDPRLSVGLANIDGMGMTVVVASERTPPHVANPKTKQWVPLQASPVLTPPKKRLIT